MNVTYESNGGFIYNCHQNAVPSQGDSVDISGALYMVLDVRWYPLEDKAVVQLVML